MSVATIEAEFDARLHAERVEQAEADLKLIPTHNQEHALKLISAMRRASATITKCAERMQTCKPQARFAYAAQITKAKRRFSWADNDLRRLT